MGSVSNAIRDVGTIFLEPTNVHRVRLEDQTQKQELSWKRAAQIAPLANLHGFLVQARVPDAFLAGGLI